MPQDPSAALTRLPLDDAPLAFVDVETTGLDPWSGHRICEVAVVRCHGEAELTRLVTLVNPLRPISPGAFAVNGITAAMVTGAPPFRQVASAVRAALDGAVVVGHNAPFDLGFLGRELALAGERQPVGPVLDTLALARRNFRFPSNGLGAVAAAFGVRGGAHRALGDALTTRAIFHQMTRAICGPGAAVAEVIRHQGGRIDWPPAPFPSALPAGLAEALASGRTLCLWYVAGDGAATMRLVDPIEVTSRAGSPSLVAYCHLRREQRTFRLDRIVRWEMATQSDATTGEPRTGSSPTD